MLLGKIKDKRRTSETTPMLLVAERGERGQEQSGWEIFRVESSFHDRKPLKTLEIDWAKVLH